MVIKLPMDRVLRSGTRRNYQKMEAGQEDDLGLENFTEHETEEETDDGDGVVTQNDNNSSDGDVMAISKVQKKEKLNKLKKEIKEMEEKLKRQKENYIDSQKVKHKSSKQKSMKDVELEVNRLLDGKCQSKKGKKKSRIKSRSRRYVISSSESNSSSSSQDSETDSDDLSDVSRSSSSSCSDTDKRKKSRRKKKSKSKSGRRISRRSGKNKKISSNVKFPQQWPHSQLSLHFVSKDKKFDELSIQEFCAGYATILENAHSKKEVKHRITHLKELMYLATKYRWDCVLNFHAACLLEVERGNLSWGDSFQSLQITTLAGGFMESGAHRSHPTITIKDGPVSFCKNYQRGACTEDGDHQGELNGSIRFLRHICARCWLVNRKKAPHPEEAVDCPSRD